MGFEAKVDDDRVVVAVDVCVHPVQALEDLADGCGKVFGKGDADTGWEDGFVVNVELDPAH